MNNKKYSERAPLTVSIEKAYSDALKEKASTENRSVSELVNSMVADYLLKNKIMTAESSKAIRQEIKNFNALEFAEKLRRGQA